MDNLGSSNPNKNFCSCMGLTHAIFFQCLDCGQLICEAFDPTTRKCPLCSAYLEYPREIESLLSNRKIKIMSSFKKELPVNNRTYLNNECYNNQNCLKTWHSPKSVFLDKDDDFSSYSEQKPVKYKRHVVKRIG